LSFKLFGKQILYLNFTADRLHFKHFRTVEDNKEKVEIYSKRVRAGKRTYFFDVKSTRGNDYYLTITESKRRYREDGFSYEKHKIFLYKEDFEKFSEGLKEAIDHIRLNQPQVDQTNNNHDAGGGFSDVNFDDLGK
jgi:Protein of unknown function (DUF3276)